MGLTAVSKAPMSSFGGPKRRGRYTPPMTAAGGSQLHENLLARGRQTLCPTRRARTASSGEPGPLTHGRSGQIERSQEGIHLVGVGAGRTEQVVQIGVRQRHRQHRHLPAQRGRLCGEGLRLRAGVAAQ